MSRPYTEHNFIDQNLNNIKCSICIDVIYDAACNENCGHIYCKECIENSLINNPHCPECNCDFSIQNNNTKIR